MIKMYQRFIIIPMLYYLDALLDETLYLSDTKKSYIKVDLVKFFRRLYVSPQADYSQFIIKQSM